MICRSANVHSDEEAKIQRGFLRWHQSLWWVFGGSDTELHTRSEVLQRVAEQTAACLSSSSAYLTTWPDERRVVCRRAGLSKGRELPIWS
jgi:hypothetical protein